MKKLVLIAILASTSWSCRSADKPEESSANNKEDLQESYKGGAPANSPNPLCASKPQPVACCEALTPSCNQCRQENEAQQVAWEQACLPEGKAPPKCNSAPDISDCCTEYTEACEQCRLQAAAKLLAWKAACGTYEAHSCDEQPPTSMCCQAMIPSCQQCKERNQRIRTEWEERCLKGALDIEN